MKFIVFQKLDFNYIYFILYFISCLLKDFLYLKFKKKYKSDYKNRGHFYEVIDLIAANLSDFLSIIPLFINKKLSKNKNQPTVFVRNESYESSKSDNNYYIYHNNAEIVKKKKFKILNLYTFLTGLLNFLVNIMTFLYYLYFQINYNGYYGDLFNFELSFQIFAQYIVSLFVLKTHFYRHHYLSIIINFTAFIIIITFDIIDKFFGWPFDMLYFVLYLFLVLEYAYGKKAMIYGYISPYTLLILIGVYKNILVFIFMIIFIPIMLSLEENFFADITDFNYVRVLFVLGNFVLSFFSNLFNWILIDRFSPSHLALSLIAEDFSFNIMTIIIYRGEENYKIKNEFQLAIRIILYIILFVTAMLHNEIFIITKCGLGDNTKLYLEKRLEEEKILSNPDTKMEELSRYDTVYAIEMENNPKENGNEQADNDDNNNNLD